ncbi:MAG: phenylacetate--CoA ligase family protein, partial [SAR324 cluster bacterium]|nr:phenylacetate--CoA ligase family protein [SAR324 cluster bacterium]
EFIVEVVDPKTLEPVPEGEEGELILTNLSRIGFPIIRYRTGDLVRLNQAPCACGRTFARFEGGVLGRADDMVVIRGVNVFPSAVENLVRRCDAIVEFRIRVSSLGEMSELYVEIELQTGTDLNAAQEQVHHEISSGLGLRPEVKVVEPGTLPRFEMKAKRFLRSS